MIRLIVIYLNIAVHHKITLMFSGWPDPAIYRKTCDFWLASATEVELRVAAFTPAILELNLRVAAPKPAILAEIIAIF